MNKQNVIYLKRLSIVSVYFYCFTISCKLVKEIFYILYPCVLHQNCRFDLHLKIESFNFIFRMHIFILAYLYDRKRFYDLFSGHIFYTTELFYFRIYLTLYLYLMYCALILIEDCVLFFHVAFCDLKRIRVK